MTRLASRERVQPVPASLTRTVGLFNTTNNSQDDFGAKCADRWRHIKTPSMHQEALPKGDIYTTMARTQGRIYNTFLTAMKRYVKR